LAIYGLLGITQPYLNRCGEILPTNQQNPLTLLPVARSPSQLHYCNCW